MILETQTVGLAGPLFPNPRNCRLCLRHVLLPSGDLTLAECVGRLVGL